MSYLLMKHFKRDLLESSELFDLTSHTLPSTAHLLREMSYSHKPGSLKQQNKRHKSEKKRGTSNSNVKSRNSSKILNKQQRLSSLKQRRTLRTSMLKQAMLLRGVPENPIWCVFVPLTRTVPVHLANLLFQKCDPEALVDGPNGLQQVVQIYSRMFDKHFCLVSAKFGDLFGCIDLIQTADHVILVVPSDLTELDWSTESFLTALSAQGLPDATFAVMSSGANLKMIRNILQSRFPVPDDAVCQLNTTAHGISLMRRVCSALRGDSFKYKSPSESSHSAARFRSKLLANSISLTSANAENPDLVEESPSSETYLYIQGHLRGSPLFFRDPLEQLTVGAKGPFVHLAGWGDFPLAGAQWKDKRSGAQRWSVTDFVPQSDEGASALLRTSTISDASPCDSDESEGSNSMDSIQMSIDEKFIPDGTASSLPDTTVDTDTEAMGCDDSLSEYMVKTTASSGTSAFSAAQLAKFRAARNEELFPDEVETPPFLPARERFSKYRSLPKFHGSVWPVEKDTLPLHYENIACFRNYHRNRRSIARYLQKRIATVEKDQSSTLKYVPVGVFVQLCIGPMNKETIEAILDRHSSETIDSSKESLAPHPLVVWSLLPHETRISVCHYTMRRVNRAMEALSDVVALANAANKASENATLASAENAALEFGEEASTRVEMESETVQDSFTQYKNASLRKSRLASDDPTLPPEAEPIKSKELMLFQVGIRRFIACPIYSTQTLGAHEKAKFEQFFSATQASVVATVYAPVMYAPANVLQFRIRINESEDGELSHPYLGELVATGTLHSVDPSRLIIKRIFLSGHPYKIQQRHVVVRFMFFNPTDVQYFKAVPLQTKSGACGFIKEPVGTHGHMKCVFDKQLQASDVVLLPLYKRIFPKFLYQPMVVKVFQASRQPLSPFTCDVAPVTLQLRKKQSSSSADNHDVSDEANADIPMADTRHLY